MAFDPAAIEVGALSAVPETVSTLGFAMFRGMISPDVAARFAARAKAHFDEAESQGGSRYMTNWRQNVCTYEVLDAPDEPFAAIRSVVDTGLLEAFDDMLGPDWVVSMKETPVFKANGNRSRAVIPHRWHQDACVNQYPTALVWIALTPCGEDAPGLKIVCHNPGQPLAPFLVEGADEGPKEKLIADMGWADRVVRPVFRPGDAIFFDQHSIHASDIAPDMTKDRLAFKITGVPRHSAHIAGACIPSEQLWAARAGRP